MDELARRLRRFGWKGGPLHQLDDARKGILRSTPIEDFFAAEFLERAFQRRVRHIGIDTISPRIVTTIRYVWPDAHTVGDVERKCSINCNQLAIVPGFGQGCIALFIDAFAVFGIEIKFDPRSAVPPSSTPGSRVRQLIEDLGIR